MGKISFRFVKYAVSVVLIAFCSLRGFCQTGIPEVLQKGSLSEQLNYINEKTRIYEEYRAIREDMFQKIKDNTLDSVTSARSKVIALNNHVKLGERKIDSLNSSITSLNETLEKVSRTKNSMNILGIEIVKSAYNLLMWTIIAVLAGLLTFGFMVFRRNMTTTFQAKKECDELKKEFDAYRKASREAREKMSMAHFNELKKLRGA